MNKKLFLIPFFSAAIAFGPIAIAADNSYDNTTSATATTTTTSDSQHGCPCKEKMLAKLMDSLKLDESQRSKINSIKERAKSEMMAHREEMKSLKAEMRTLVTSETMDESKLNSLAQRKAELQTKMFKNKMMMKNQMYNVLNADQKAQFKSMLEKWETEKKDTCH